MVNCGRAYGSVQHHVFPRFAHFRSRSILPLARSAPSLQNASGGAPIGARLYLNSPSTGELLGTQIPICGRKGYDFHTLQKRYG